MPGVPDAPNKMTFNQGYKTSWVQDESQFLMFDSIELGLSLFSDGDETIPLLNGDGDGHAFDSSKKHLDFSGTHMTRLPESIMSFSYLLRLELSNTCLEALPDSIGHLKKLRILNASGNMLKFLPESLSYCSDLAELNLSFNELQYLPSNFGIKLGKLETLCLQLNKLNVLPESMCYLKSLKNLELQFNKLLSLPSDIGNLRSLEKLNASSNFNNLESLPYSIGDLKSLVELDLSYNQIRELPYSFSNLKALKRLKLDQNPLMFPPIWVADHSIKAVLEYVGERASLLPDIERGFSGPLIKKDVQKNSSGKSSWLPWLNRRNPNPSSCRLGGSSFRFASLGTD